MNVKRRKGAAAVEFAVVAPLFFVFVFGIVEFGRAFYVQHALTSIARAAAREASIEGATASQVRELAENDLKQLGLSAAKVAFEGKTPENALRGDAITVKITVSFRDVALVPPMWGDRTLAAMTTMRKE